MLLAIVAIAAGLAALVHVYIFVLETLRWEQPATRRVFGTSAEQAATTKQLAANQGVYNLLLAVVTGIGIVLLWPAEPVGLALVLAGTGSMLVAALYLVVTDASKLRAAAVQGSFPLLAVAASVLALAL